MLGLDAPGVGPVNLLPRSRLERNVLDSDVVVAVLAAVGRADAEVLFAAR